MIDLDNALYLYTNTFFDEDLAEIHPPSFAKQTNDMSPDIAAMLHDAGVRTAKKYDRYCPIFQLSTLHKGTYTHYLIGDPNTSAKPASDCFVYFVDREEGLIRSFIESYENLLPSVVAGWEINQDWAMIVNRCVKYGIPLGLEHKQDPMVRYSTNKSLLSIANIYQQALPPSIRALPDLQDALDFWDIEIPEHPYGNILSTQELYNAKPELWLKKTFAAHAAAPLFGMQAVLRNYYKTGDGYGNMSNMSGNPSAEARGPRPQHTASV